jgi:protoporphyrin/coproporphyrin ferrochelatase
MTILGAVAPDTPLHQETASTYDALLIVSYGGPESHEDVLPFLENATRGRNVPRERLLEVAEHYHHFGGVSPINEQNRRLMSALRIELSVHGIGLPIYLGNRNWHPFITDTLRQMRDDGVRRALALVTSTFSCYSGCRQYREDVARAIAEVGEGAPQVDKVRMYFNHPGFIAANGANLTAALTQFPAERRSGVRVLFTAHSIPLAMARGSAYEVQLTEAARLVAAAAGVDSWDLVFQSRSGPPSVPWLEPDVCDHLTRLAEKGVRDVVALPIGFVSDHMEVRYDLDTEALDRARRLGLNFVRAATVGTSPGYLAMLRELIEERLTDHPVRRALGTLGPSHDICPVGCCPDGRARPG